MLKRISVPAFAILLAATGAAWDATWAQGYPTKPGR
jgi:hypothetical protein